MASREALDPLYRSMSAVSRMHYQYNTLVVVKIEVAERRRTTSQIKRSNPINIYGIESSPSDENEYRRRRHEERRCRDWGGSHRVDQSEAAEYNNARGSKVTDDTGEASDERC